MMPQLLCEPAERGLADTRNFQLSSNWEFVIKLVSGSQGTNLLTDRPQALVSKCPISQAPLCVRKDLQQNSVSTEMEDEVEELTDRHMQEL